MEDKDLLEIIKQRINNYDFKSKFEKFLKDYLQENEIYKYVSATTEFINDYTGKICYDYSGEVESFKNKEEIIEFINSGDWIFESMSNESVLSALCNGQKEATYISNMGWHYITIKDDLERYFDELKYDLYAEFIKEYKQDIITIFNLEYENDSEFEDNIYDNLDSTIIDDYMVWESSGIFYDYLEQLTDEEIINFIK